MAFNVEQKSEDRRYKNPSMFIIIALPFCGDKTLSILFLHLNLVSLYLLFNTFFFFYSIISNVSALIFLFRKLTHDYRSSHFAFISFRFQVFIFFINSKNNNENRIKK